MTETKTNGNLPAVQPKTPAGVLTAEKDRLLAMLPEIASGAKIRERLFSMAIAAVKDPKLAQCSPASVIEAVMKSIQAGLPIDGIHAAIVPQKEKGVLKAQFRAMYQGLVAVGRRSKEVRQVWAECVYQGERFEVQLGSEPRIAHVPQWDVERTPQTMTHAYACMRWTADDRVEFVVITKQQIEETRSRAPAKEFGPWSKDEDYPEMAKKTAIRRLSKRMPIDPDAKRVFDEDEKDELGLREAEAEVVHTSGKGPKLDQLLQARSEAKAKAREPSAAIVDPEPSQEPHGSSGDPASDDPFAGWQDGKGEDPG